MLLDWIEPQAFSLGTAGFALAASGASPEALIAMPEFEAERPFDEFFLIQNRTRTGNDALLPGDGLIVWHVDARLDSGGRNFLYDNSYAEHKLLRLMEADGLEQIERGYAANAGDYYTAGRTLSSSTWPSCLRYDGTTSGLTLDSIGPNGGSMPLRVDIRYTLFAPDAANTRRLKGDFIFFTEYVDRLTWSDHPLNHTRITAYRIFKRPTGRPSDPFVLLAEIPAEDEPVYENKGLREDERYVYRIVAIDLNGVESEPAETSS